jgi:Fe-S cluster assembly protein SufD
MQLADLPSRRSEAWKWSDLRAALSGDEAMLTGSAGMPAAGPIAALAGLTANSGQDRGVVVPAGTEKTLIERIAVTASGKMLAAYSAIEVGAGATLTRVVVQEDATAAGEAGPGIVLNEVVVKLAKGATYRQFVLGEGAKLARIETTIAVEGEGVEVELKGVYLAAGKRHIDLTSRVTHAVPGGTTRQLVRGVARKGGRGVFQGKFLVERGAQKTDAEMEHNALLLEEGAEVFAKPELEIYADDVQCAHGNTAGQLNEDAIFYLRQRGLPEIEARALITRAFLIEALPDWLDAGLRDEIEARIDLWLGASA